MAPAPSNTFPLDADFSNNFFYDIGCGKAAFFIEEWFFLKPDILLSN
jgi:hypothetical protein